MRNFSDSLPEGWLAFELGVLRRLKFRSVIDPFAGEGATLAYLKRWGARVAANDSARWALERARARVENNAETLSESDVEAVLEDAYVPRHRLYNPALRHWFGETDAWWFDNVRANAEKLEPAKRSLALDLGMAVGDYALAFDDDTRELRQPLSRAFQRLLDCAPAPFDNKQKNTASNRDARDFVGREQAELLFLGSPAPRAAPRATRPGPGARSGCAATETSGTTSSARARADSARAPRHAANTCATSKTSSTPPRTCPRGPSRTLTTATSRPKSLSRPSAASAASAPSTPKTSPS